MTTTTTPRGPWTRADLELLPDTSAHDEIVETIPLLPGFACPVHRLFT
jgi:hypothetical protein